jgi:hypothetical protein
MWTRYHDELLNDWGLQNKHYVLHDTQVQDWFHFTQFDRFNNCNLCKDICLQVSKGTDIIWIQRMERHQRLPNGMQFYLASRQGNHHSKHNLNMLQLQHVSQQNISS